MAQRRKKHCTMCEATSDVAGFGGTTGWYRLDRCIPCWVIEQHNLRGYKRSWTLKCPRAPRVETKERKPRAKKTVESYKCVLCGVTPDDGVVFWSGKRCRPCYYRTRGPQVRTEKDKIRAREGMRKLRTKRKIEELESQPQSTSSEESVHERMEGVSEVNI